jgi:hypothetical protein
MCELERSRERKRERQWNWLFTSGMIPHCKLTRSMGRYRASSTHIPYPLAIPAPNCLSHYYKDYKDMGRWVAIFLPSVKQWSLTLYYVLLPYIFLPNLVSQWPQRQWVTQQVNLSCLHICLASNYFIHAVLGEWDVFVASAFPFWSGDIWWLWLCLPKFGSP